MNLRPKRYRPEAVTDAARISVILMAKMDLPSIEKTAAVRKNMLNVYGLIGLDAQYPLT